MAGSRAVHGPASCRCKASQSPQSTSLPLLLLAIFRLPRQDNMLRKKRAAQVHYHPFFFLLMALVAMTELGLTAFLINAGNEHDSWPSPRYHAL